MFRKLFHFFIFSSLFIAGGAVLMVYQTNDLLNLHYDTQRYMLFVFCATVCSYNFHWFLTPQVPTEKMRMQWTQQHKLLHLVFFVAGGIGAAWSLLHFIEHWFWLGGAVLLTFLYSAPKIPHPLFRRLKEIAIGKTLFLAFVWMYVTTWLPVVISGNQLLHRDILFCASRFFFIYAICIPFDYRDREFDRHEGIRSMVTYFDEKGIDSLFHLTLILFLITTVSLLNFGVSILPLLLILVPGFILLRLYPVVKKNFSDYLFYFVLDGLMALPAALTSLLPH